MADEEPTLRRRNPKNQGGRPRFEDIEELTPEMEEICQLRRAGFIPTEIAERLRCSTEKVARILDNPRVKARIQLLFGDRLSQIALGRDEMWDAVKRSVIRQANNDTLPLSELSDILKRYDPYERLEALTKNENRLLQGKKDGKVLGSGNITPVNEEAEPIFGPLKIEG